MNNGNTTKRHTRDGRTPPLVPVPESTSWLLKLVNLIPGGLRFPKWARLDRGFEDAEVEIGAVRRVFDSLGESLWLSTPYISSYSAAAERLWFDVFIAIQRLPTVLQAFVLNDDFGKILPGLGVPEFLSSVDETVRNFRVLVLSSIEIDRILSASRQKMYAACQRDALTVETIEIEGEEYQTTNIETLALRARQRLIFLMATQEIVSCLTLSEPNEELSYCTVVPLSEASRPVMYVDESGKFSPTTPFLFHCLANVDVGRIRECVLCYQFFWAGRKDQKTCTTRCAKILRTRRWRENIALKKQSVDNVRG